MPQPPTQALRACTSDGPTSPAATATPGTGVSAGSRKSLGFPCRGGGVLHSNLPHMEITDYRDCSDAERARRRLGVLRRAAAAGAHPGFQVDYDGVLGGCAEGGLEI
jgi:hypothetical protein